MNVLRFKKGYKGWETTYEAELDFEYTSLVEKHVTSLILKRPDLGVSAVIPWQVFEEYTKGENNSVYIDSTGLKMRYLNGQLQVSWKGSFNIVIHADQIEAIKKVAKRVSESVSYSVENILKEYSALRH